MPIHLSTRHASRAARLTLVLAAVAMLLLGLGARLDQGVLVLAGALLALATAVGVLVHAWRRMLPAPPMLAQSEADAEHAMGRPRAKLVLADSSYWFFGPGAGGRPVPGDTILHFRAGRLVGYVVRLGQGTPVGELPLDVLRDGVVAGA